MKIGIISDTHIPVSASAIPGKVIEYFSGTDLILHTGDFVDLAVLEELKRISCVEAVHGNMDPPEVKQILPRKKTIQVGSFKIGLIHGSGSPLGLMERIAEEFSGERLDAIVFGHSHSPYQQIVDSVLFFNPGSPTDGLDSVNTFGLIEIADRITARIIEL